VIFPPNSPCPKTEQPNTTELFPNNSQVAALESLIGRRYDLLAIIASAVRNDLDGARA